MDCDQATTTASTSWHESKRSPCSFCTPEEIRLPRLCPIQSFTLSNVQGYLMSGAPRVARYIVKIKSVL